MFCYLKPWQFCKLLFNECQKIQTKNLFHKILSLSFDLGPLKVINNASNKS
jgi:hypothetical protein